MMGDAIRRFRQEKGLTMRRLASMIGVTDSYISLLEKNAEDPSVSVLRKLSKALEKPISAFFEEDFSEPGITSAADREIHSTADGNVDWEILTSPSADDAGVTMLRVAVAPGAVIRCEGIPEQACIYLQDGSAFITLPDVSYTMQTGDSLYLQPFIPFTAACFGTSASSCVVSLSGKQLPSILAERSTI